MDRETCQATVLRVAKSQTWLHTHTWSSCANYPNIYSNDVFQKHQLKKAGCLKCLLTKEVGFYWDFKHLFLQKFGGFLRSLIKWLWKHRKGRSRSILSIWWPVPAKEPHSQKSWPPWYIFLLLLIRASQVVLVVQNLPVNAGDIRNIGSIPGWGRSPGEGHGNPLQYLCLQNPMDRGAWRVMVHRVTKSWTRLKRFSAYARITDQVKGKGAFYEPPGFFHIGLLYPSSLPVL